MSATRPIDSNVFLLAVAWFGIALCIVLCQIFILTRGQSWAGKLLYTVGGILMMTLPAAVAFEFAITSWYGGKPDAAASVDGQFYVREKYRLTPVSAEEFRWLERMHRQQNWFFKPCLAAVACFALGRLTRPRARTASGATTASPANDHTLPAEESAERGP